MKKQAPPAKRLPPPPRPKRTIPRPPAAPSKSTSQSFHTAKEPVSYWRRYRYYILAFVLALAVFGACAYLMRRQILLGREIQVFRRINDWPEKLHLGFVTITAFGSVWAGAFLVAAAFLLRLYQLAWRLALSIFTVSGLLIILKDFFARSRPEQFVPDLYVRVFEPSFAFPSAHAAMATVLALTVRTYLPIPAIWQWVVVSSWIGGVSLSRIYLGVHTPLDVVGGVALGVGVVCFWRIVPTFVKRFLHLK